MAQFQAPTEQTGTWTSHGSLQAEKANALWRHYGTRTVGRNVYYLSNGTVTETDPDGETVTWADVRTVWWGGHAPVDITAAEEAALTEAGYTVIE